MCLLGLLIVGLGVVVVLAAVDVVCEDRSWADPLGICVMACFGVCSVDAQLDMCSEILC